MWFKYELHSVTAVSETSKSALSSVSKSTLDATIILEPLAVGSDEIEKVIQISITSCSVLSAGNKNKRDCESGKNRILAYLDSKGEIGAVFAHNTSRAFEKEFWNAAIAVLSFVSTTSTPKEKDQHFQDFPVGRCLVSNRRSKLGENEKLLRQIWNCQSIGSGKEDFLALPPTQKYSQTADFLIHENGLIFETVEATETYTITIPIYEKSSLKIVSNVDLKLMMERRSTDSTRNPCADLSVQNCLTKIQNMPDSLFLGNSWSDIRTALWDQTRQKKRYGKAQDILATEEPSPEKAEAFLKVVNALRHSNFAEIQHELKEPEHDHILGVFADALAAAGTRDSHEAGKKLLALESPDILEKYLVSLSHVNAADDWLVQDMLDSCNDTSLDDMQSTTRECLFRATAALVHRNCMKSQSCHSNLFVTSAIHYFKNELTKCKTSKNSVKCLKTVFGYFENLGSARSLPVLLRYSCPKDPDMDKTVPTAVLKVLASVSPKEWSDRTVSTLWSIYYNRCGLKLDSSTRSLAAELLLLRAKFDSQVAPNLLKLFLNVSSNAERELFTFTLDKIKDVAATENWSKATLRQMLRDSGVISQAYDRLAHGGVSAAYSAPIFGDQNAASYSLQMEFAYGILKRSGLQVYIQNTPVLTFDLFSRGLESLIGEKQTEETEEEDDELASTAGMQLGFFGIKQGPLTFFEGQGELMSAVWAADGHPMTAYEGQFLPLDFRIVLPLSNGLVLRLNVIGGVSLKMTGSIEVSIWYRSSKSLIQTNANVVIVGRFMTTEGNYGAGPLQSGKTKLMTGTKINFATDVDFYETPFKMCMKMEAPKSQIRQWLALNENRWKISRRRSLEGRSFVTHPKISRMCSDLEAHLEGL